ncbi:MAG TPA: hypothetical protein PLL90_10515, partial [Bacteroidales bacterium]|nr:hypothetical protein [Bacteroidales bacterium]
MINYLNDIDDIIFRNRNKEYGAYYLRKNYNRYLLIATILAVTFFVLCWLLPLLAGKTPEKKLSEGALYTEYLGPPPKEIKKPDEDLPPQLRKVQRMAK